MANMQKGGPSVAEQVKETGANVMERAKETGANLMDKAKETAGTVAEKVGDAASYMGKKADDAASATGSGLKSLGETIQEKGPQSGVLGSATSAVAGSLRSGGSYLEDRGLSGMGEDLTQLIRRNPGTSVLIGIGLGFLLARLTSRS
jgi:hypothetical protein